MGVVGLLGDVVHLVNKFADALEDKRRATNWHSTTITTSNNYHYYGPVVVHQYNYYESHYLDENGDPIYVMTASQQYIHPQLQYLLSVQDQYAALPPAQTVEYSQGDYLEVGHESYEDYVQEDNQCY